MFNSGFPVTYPGYNYQNQQNQQMYPNQNYQYMQQNQQGPAFIRVQSENDARLYPVAPGSSVSFVNENEPYIYTKTVDASQLDRPKFDKYRLVKEDADTPSSNEDKVDYKAFALKSDLEAAIADINEKIKGIQQYRRRDNKNEHK